MPNRLLGISDEQRLEIEQATGLKTEAVRLLFEATQAQVDQATKQLETKTREISALVGPHGAVTRLQAGGVKISPGLGIAAYEDGVLKTSILPSGDLLVGDDITLPARTSLAVFVKEQTYNNELMGAGDALFGDNTEAVSNVKFDASEGQLQFRYGQTINVYMDTDGELKSGAGAVVQNADGVSIEGGSSYEDRNALKFTQTGAVLSYLMGDTSLGNMLVAKVMPKTGANSLMNFLVDPASGQDAIYNVGVQDASANTLYGLYFDGGETYGRIIGRMKNYVDNITPSMGGAIFDHYTNAGTTATGEDDLYSDTLPADTFGADGDKVTADYTVAIAGNAAPTTKQVRVYFAGTLIYDSGAEVVTSAGDFGLHVDLIRVSSTVVRCGVRASTTSHTAAPQVKYTEVTGLTLSGTNILKLTGEATNTAGNNLVAARLGTVYWYPAA